MANQLFARKPLHQLLAEMEGEHRLRRVLTSVTLTSLGVGAIIGAGIFVATGKAASDTAGPALMLSYVVAGVTCIFAALCYAEFASVVPVGHYLANAAEWTGLAAGVLPAPLKGSSPVSRGAQDAVLAPGARLREAGVGPASFAGSSAAETRGMLQRQ